MLRHALEQILSDYDRNHPEWREGYNAFDSDAPLPCDASELNVVGWLAARVDYEVQQSKQAKVTADQYVATYLAWNKDSEGQRLGQYLMNKLLPDVKDPYVFYETSHIRASQAFLEHHVYT